MDIQASTGLDAVLAAGGSMGRLMRARDWAATPLGPMDGWPQSLRSSLSICLASEFPMVIYWGPRLATLYNDAYRPTLGVKHPRSLGQPADECWAEIWPTIGPMLEGVLTRGDATYSHDLLLILQRAGFREEGYFCFSFSPIRDESGGVGGVFCAVTETTERVVGARRLALVRELGERSTAAASSAAAACAWAAGVLARNPYDVPFALLYLLDGEHAELSGATGLVPGGPLSPARVALSGGGPWSLAAARTGVVEVAHPGAPQLTALAREGFDPPERALVLPIARPGAERPAGLLVAGLNSGRPVDGSSRDFAVLLADHVSAAVADATALQAERHRAEQLAALDRAKTMFFSNISHEFRTPLTLLLGPTEDLLAEREALRGSDRERVEMIHRNALRLLKLVNALLDFSRAEAGRMTPRPEPVDLPALTAELASLFQVPAERGGLRLVVDCRPLPGPVDADPDMWEKIVLNLLSNAFKFTLDGEIRVRVEAAGEHVRLVVADTGVGIPPGELPRLFDRFHRVAGTGARSEEGSGIGLSLVRELVQLHGGTVEVDSTLGAGSTFTVLMPRRAGAAREPAAVPAVPGAAPAGRASGAYVQEAMSWAPPAPAAAGEPGLAPEVLVVDDNADMRAYLHRVLAPHWRVRSVAGGREALAASAEAVPELVLSDVMMPGLDGFGLLRALRADEATRHVPVILISARAGQEAAIEGLDAGADDYLIKPFTAAELTARVRTHLETARQRRRAAERVAALAEASRRLTAGLDPDEISRVLCEEIVPAFAAGCAVWLHHDDPDGDGDSGGRPRPAPAATPGSSPATCRRRPAPRSTPRPPARHRRRPADHSQHPQHSHRPRRPCRLAGRRGRGRGRGRGGDAGVAAPWPGDRRGDPGRADGRHGRPRRAGVPARPGRPRRRRPRQRRPVRAPAPHLGAAPALTAARRPAPLPGDRAGLPLPAGRGRPVRRRRLVRRAGPARRPAGAGDRRRDGAGRAGRRADGAAAHRDPGVHAGGAARRAAAGTAQRVPRHGRPPPVHHLVLRGLRPGRAPAGAGQRRAPAAAAVVAVRAGAAAAGAPRPAARRGRGLRLRRPDLQRAAGVEPAVLHRRPGGGPRAPAGRPAGRAVRRAQRVHRPGGAVRAGDERDGPAGRRRRRGVAGSAPPPGGSLAVHPLSVDSDRSS
ncbi:hybrid sensor histidine kinase/response regulator [Actinomadura sp. ATCC 31491]|uniref:histidine kinase n=1 Tax=Actinomadura luzonensis TaxID=2805427 RepID=A0ABT0FTF7_9ACTN|nr:hybrid sensor histidine kinase/response regulator [Actinomadura luzonensis]MCK2215549.1 hybrid sensor histidine kinase/response regulator [Actinomadura luzonensis]